jgi:hypothetical protein
VKSGDVVALSDDTGHSTGSHLHFGLAPILYDINNGYRGWINPLPFIQLKGMAKLYIDKRTNPPTIVGGMELDEPTRLEWWTKETGIILPHKIDGSIDWEHVPYSGQISNN